MTNTGIVHLDLAERGRPKKERKKKRCSDGLMTVSLGNSENWADGGTSTGPVAY